MDGRGFWEILHYMFITIYLTFKCVFHYKLQCTMPKPEQMHKIMIGITSITHAEILRVNQCLLFIWNAYWSWKRRVDIWVDSEWMVIVKDVQCNYDVAVRCPDEHLPKFWDMIRDVLVNTTRHHHDHLATPKKFVACPRVACMLASSRSKFPFFRMMNNFRFYESASLICTKLQCNHSRV